MGQSRVPSRHTAAFISRQKVERTISSDSTDSTDTEHSANVSIKQLAKAAAAPKTPKARLTHCRRVNIQEEQNQVYHRDEISKDDSKALWYSSEDMACFKRDAVREAKNLLRSEIKEDVAWRKGLMQAYKGFALARSAEELSEILQDSTGFVKITPSMTGLQKWVLRPVVQDQTLRRRQLVGFVEMCNNNTTSSAASRAKTLRKASRDLSCPSRLFAHHIALMSVYAE